MKNSFQRHLILIMKSQQSKDIVIDECEEIINPYKNYVGYDLNESWMKDRRNGLRSKNLCVHIECSAAYDEKM